MRHPEPFSARFAQADEAGGHVTWCGQSLRCPPCFELRMRAYAGGAGHGSALSQPLLAPLGPDDLWAVIEPILPTERPKPKGGRPRVSDRAALTGILFVLRSGLPWEMLPQETGCGLGMTCWRRFREWQKAGVSDKIHGVLLDRLGRASAID